MAEDIVKVIIGVFVTLVVSIILLSAVTDWTTQTTCKPYITDKENCQTNYRALEAQLAQANYQLNLSEERNINLTNTNLTKKDVWDIRQDLNDTRIQLTQINQQINNLLTQFSSSYNILVKTRIISVSLGLTLFAWTLADFLGATLFGVELKEKIFPSIRRRKEAKTKQQHSNDKQS